MAVRRHPVDLSLDAPERQLFYRKLLNKNLEEINAYWSRLVFAGRTLPPDELGSRENLQSRLERDPTAIAYIEHSRVSKEMRIVLSLPE
ncbi:MAG: hypothetical protein HY849_05850 [Nitrosomonadales bacterium]|nr:hypothetical protein [Nitrosomonadales bacterium]